jgi:hypothetical protein
VIEYVIGLDLGQAQDYSAFVVLKRCWWRGGEVPAPEHMRLWHQIDMMHRWAIGTDYPTIRQNVGELYASLDIESPGGVKLVVDQGGPGRPVVDLLRPYRPVGITITGGQKVNEKPDGSLTVPKRELCSALVIAAQSGDVKVAVDHPLAKQFDEEVGSFGYKVDLITGRESYESLQSRVHDDLVLAAAMALFYSTKQLSTVFPLQRKPSVVADMDYDPLAI